MKTFISSGTGFFTIYEGERFDPRNIPDVNRYYLIWPTILGWKVKFFNYGEKMDVGDTFADEHQALAYSYDHFLELQ